MKYENYGKELNYIANVTNMNLYSLATRHSGKILLSGFNPKDKEHRFLLSIANITEQLGYGTIEIVGHPFFCFFYNLKYQKRIRSISKRTLQKYNFEDYPSCNEILDFMRPVLEETIPESDVNFGWAYELYYNERINKNA